MLGVERQRCAGVEASVGVEDFRIGLHRRGLAVEGARYDAHALAALLDQRQFSLVVMLEEGLALFMLLRQRHPGLDAGDGRTGRAQLRRGALGVGDAAPGVHPVDVARLDRLRRAERVALEDAAFEPLGDGGEVEVRVWAHVETLAGFEARRAELIPEDEGADHALLDRRQRAAHHEIVAEVARLGGDGGYHRPAFGHDIALLFVAGSYAHGRQSRARAAPLSSLLRVVQASALQHPSTCRRIRYAAAESTRSAGDLTVLFVSPRQPYRTFPHVRGLPGEAASC